jgi:Tol biopolymer transport system component
VATEAVTLLAPGNEPAWAPDGSNLVYVNENTEGDSEIQIFDIASGEVTFVTGGDDPTWSPDGTIIAFSGENTAEEPVVMTVSPGSTPAEVTGGEEPSWSPDGSELAFVRLAE